MTLQHCLQVIIGSNLLESSDTFSQLAHNTSSLAGYNTVPGNAYTMITPLLAHTGEGSKSGKHCGPCAQYNLPDYLFVSKLEIHATLSVISHAITFQVSIDSGHLALTVFHAV